MADRRNFGRLTRIDDPREGWLNEAADFTPWLAEEDNFEILADALGFTDAEVKATENPIGNPLADIAGVACFLASDDARYLTGNTLFVDGGSHINGVAWAPELPEERPELPGE